MKGPCLERSASLITVPPASGKFFIFKADGQAPLREVQCLPTDSLIHGEDTANPTPRGLLNVARPPISPGNRTLPTYNKNSQPTTPYMTETNTRENKTNSTKAKRNETDTSHCAVHHQRRPITRGQDRQGYKQTVS